MCGAKAGDPGVTLEVDHVLSVDDGGTDDLDNLATLCRRCNRGKSSLRLKDYRDLSLIPDGLRGDFRFYHDPPSGDLERFHLYLYYTYTDRAGTGPFHHEWIISGTEWATSPDRDALETRRRAEEEEEFEKAIRRELAESLTRLVRTERGLERISAAAIPPDAR
jgi:hypothetical protein